MQLLQEPRLNLIVVLSNYCSILIRIVVNKRRLSVESDKISRHVSLLTIARLPHTVIAFGR